jgi:hypothetical protein
VMSRSWCRALGAATSHNRLPASPAPLACAQGLARAGLPIGPTQGGIFISGVPPASRSPTGRLSGRACPRPWEGAWGTSTCGVAAAAPCCGPVATAVSHDGSPVATAPAAVRGALAERHLVVVGAPDLSALADARAGTIGVTLRTIEEE